MITLTRSELLWNIRALETAITEAQIGRNEPLERELQALRLKFEAYAAGEGALFELTSTAIPKTR